MGCVTKIIQFLFFAFNFVFFCLGIAVFAVGIYSRVENDSWRALIESSSMFQAANILIAAGVLVAIIGFFGCCGAWKRSSCMLLVYSVLIIVIFILEIAAGIYAYVKRNTIEDSLTTKLTRGVSENYGGDDTASKAFTIAIDWFQQKVKCCGAGGPSDWKDSVWYRKVSNREEMVPETCCKIKSTNCNSINSYNDTSIFANGCVTEGKNFAKGNLYLIGGVGIGIAVVQLFGILFAIALRKSFDNEEKNGKGHTEKA